MSLPFLALKLGDKMVQYSVHAFSVVVQQLQKCPFPSTFLQQKTEIWSVTLKGRELGAIFGPVMLHF